MGLFLLDILYSKKVSTSFKNNEKRKGTGFPLV
jgi:hypothetical protein